MKMWMTPVKAEQPGNSVESILTFNSAAVSQAFDVFFLQGEQTDFIALTVLSRVCEFFPASLQKGDTDGSISFFLVFITLPINAAFQSIPVAHVMFFTLPSPFINVSVRDIWGGMCLCRHSFLCTANVKATLEI